MNAAIISEMAKTLFREEREIKRLDGWFLMKESYKNHAAETQGMSEVKRAAVLLKKAIEELPLSISRNAVFAGTQRDAFARSYALINPSFRVETFSGYCDPTAVYGDIDPNEIFTPERITSVKVHDLKSDYVKNLSETYRKVEGETAEVVYFIEQVTGHVIPDVRYLLANGVEGVLARIDKAEQNHLDIVQKEQYAAMRITMEALLCLAERYADLAAGQLDSCTDETDKVRLTRMVQNLRRVPLHGAKTLPEAIQSFMLIWQLMCLEQAPNPFAFSVGNADRIFEPYRAAENLSREDTAALLKHFLVFFNVADRSWAI